MAELGLRVSRPGGRVEVGASRPEARVVLHAWHAVLYSGFGAGRCGWSGAIKGPDCQDGPRCQPVTPRAARVVDV